MNDIEHYIEKVLSERKRKGMLRILPAAASAAASAAIDGSSASLLSSNHNISCRKNDHNNSHDDSKKQRHHDPYDVIDFSSNDYLGLASDHIQQELVQETFSKFCNNSNNNNNNIPILGSTGSRLLSGDHIYYNQLEQYIATNYHHRQYGILCNSGYDANLSVLSCLPCHIILYDEYCHNSIQIGIRLWKQYSMKTSNVTTTTHEDDNSNKNDNINSQNQYWSSSRNNQKQRTSYSFRHNNLDDMEQKLIKIRRNIAYANNDEEIINLNPIICIVIESVYSMDGDIANINDILKIAFKYNVFVVIDEAHGLGIYGEHGMGIIEQYNLERHPSLLCSIHTYGKGAGCHGAIICTNVCNYKDYIINYSYPFIYSTSLPIHSLITIECSYQTMTNNKGMKLRQTLFNLVQYYRINLQKQLSNMLHQVSNTNNNNQIQSSLFHVELLKSKSPIQGIIIPGNEQCTQFCHHIYKHSKQCIKVYPIKSPTVPAGTERVRIIIHAHNTYQQIDLFIHYTIITLYDMLTSPMQETYSSPSISQVVLPQSRL